MLTQGLLILRHNELQPVKKIRASESYEKVFIFQRRAWIPICLQVQSRPESSRASSCPRMLSRARRNRTREGASSKLISELALTTALLPRVMVQFLEQLSGKLPVPSRSAPWSWLGATQSRAGRGSDNNNK